MGAPKSLRTIFDEVSELERGKQRQAYLDQACQGDGRLRANVEALLRAEEKAGGFLANPKHEGDRIGRYTLLEKIGEGGCGVVYMAEQIEPVRRRVALKIIRLGMDTRSVIARFQSERQAMALMDHPGIAQVFDAGTTETGRPFFVMELVRGTRITGFCDQNHLSTTDRLRLFIQVCQAVQHAHQKGIIHRDLKPSNILVALHDGVPMPKVIDFGIAKATEAPLTDATIHTQLHHFIGTPAYMSPEQAEMSALDIDTRSDIYSLGVLLYELLTSKTPLDARELMNLGIDAMRKTIRENEPVRPSTKLATLQGDERTITAKQHAVEMPRLIHRLKGDLDWIVMKCLEKDRARRYDTANSLAADLKRHLDNETVSARPPSSSYRFQKLVRRNRLAFGAAGAVAIALLLGFVASTWQLVRATRAEQEQSSLRALAEQAQAQAESNAEKFRTAAIQSRRSQYAADVFAATAAIEAGSYSRAHSLLREYFPRDGLEELRGFEWRYWWQLSAGQQLKTLPVSGQILDMAWSPDGRIIATASSDRTIKLLRPDTGQVVSVLTNGTDFNVSIAFSHDGNGLAIAGIDGRVQFWDVRDGKLLFTRTYNAPRVSCSRNRPLMAIGTGGDLWAQRGEDVHIVDTESGLELRMLPKAGDRAVFSPDGRRLASANWGAWNSGSQAVILWDVDSGQKLRALENMRQVVSMDFSPDGRLLAAGTRAGEIILWNLSDFSHTILREATRESIWSVMFSPQGRRLAVAMLTQEVEVWDVQEQRRVQRLPGHAHQVRAVAFSPDGNQLASGSLDGTIKFWDPVPPTIPILIPNVRLGRVGAPTFSGDGRWLAAGTKRGNGDVEIVDTTPAAWKVRTVLTNAGFPVAFFGDATLWTLSEFSRALQRWDMTSGALISSNNLNAAKEPWLTMATSLDGSHFTLATYDLMEVFETASGRCLDRFPTPVNTDYFELSGDGLTLAIAAGNEGILRDVTAGRVLRTLAGHNNKVVAIAFSPDQRMIATGSWDHTARLWDVTTGKDLAMLAGHKAPVKRCLFSPDGRSLVTGSDDHTIKFWNLATFREVGSIQTGYTPLFFTFSPDGRILVAEISSPDGIKQSELRCWRAPSLAEIDEAEAKEPATIMR